MLAAAFALGFLGSAHCAGMCGPLVLAIRCSSNSSNRRFRAGLAYNLGRMMTYGVLGLICGAFGQALSFAGLQRWTSLLAGSAMVLGALVPSRLASSGRVGRSMEFARRAVASWLGHPSPQAHWRFGLVNGLLPCGLVYAAVAGAAASPTAWDGAAYMMVFGAGTLPMMLILGMIPTQWRGAMILGSSRWTSATLVVVGGLLILRGLNLGIPFVSPSLEGPGMAGESACHAPGGLELRQENGPVSVLNP